jgi:hypothetical protein
MTVHRTVIRPIHRKNNFLKVEVRIARRCAENEFHGEDQTG